MSKKYRIHEINIQESRELFGSEEYAHIFCLVTKRGEPYVTEAGKIAVYMPATYSINALEAYCYISQSLFESSSRRLLLWKSRLRVLKNIVISCIS